MSYRRSASDSFGHSEGSKLHEAQPSTITSCLTNTIKVTGYLELYDFIYVYIYATKTGILKS